MFYKLVVRRLLFLFDPEKVHNWLVRLLKLPLVSRILKLVYHYDHPSLRREIFGLTFKNPVGMAAGFDKNAEIYSQLGDLGFGFIEIGTVTPRPQPGNPKPRIFRLPDDNALINRMGFNNEGVETAAKRLREKPASILIAGNIGKNKTTPNSEAIRDYELDFNTLYEAVDLFVVNVSSPNTPNLRDLQEKEPLTQLLNRLMELNVSKPKTKPILLKIAPDMGNHMLDDILEIVENSGIHGIVATNTTIGRDGLKTPSSQVLKAGSGGLSGKPLRDRSTEVIRYLHEKSGGRIPVIGVGGIHSPRDAIAKLKAGASLVEIYTGFIYEGPSIIKRINKAILKNESKP